MAMAMMLVAAVGSDGNGHDVGGGSRAIAQRGNMVGWLAGLLADTRAARGLVKSSQSL